MKIFYFFSKTTVQIFYMHLCLSQDMYMYRKKSIGYYLWYNTGMTEYYFEKKYYKYSKLNLVKFLM